MQSRWIKPRSSVHTPVLVLLLVILMVLGSLNLYSASLGGSYFYAQLKHMLVGVVAFFAVGWIVPLKHINTYAFIFYGLLCALLAAVLLLGHTAGGSQRWLMYGPIRMQPSEFAKIGIAMAVARFFYTHRQPMAYRIRDLWLVLSMIAVVFALIFKQPDLGTAGVCLLIGLIQIAFVKLNHRSVGFVAVAFVATAIVGWNYLLRDYQRLRILNLINPGLDPYGSGYNSRQSLVAVGSGKLFGKGFLEGTQTQLQFLPARHTDFVFSVFAEEHGFWACLLVFVLFGSLTYVGLEVARLSRNVFSSLLAVGVSALMFLEFLINVAMVLGVFPVVGMPLPFFSYGGSSLLTVCVCVGLLVAIDRETVGLSTKRRASMYVY